MQLKKGQTRVHTGKDVFTSKHSLFKISVYRGLRSRKILACITKIPK